jgi:hypothetical protein
MHKGRLIIVPGAMVKLGRAFCEIIRDCINEKVANNMQKQKT